MNRFMIKGATTAAAIALSLAGAGVANAAVDWTAWTAATTGSTAGTATGTAGSVGVSYSGEVDSLQANYPSWNPVATFNGAGNAPPQSGGIIQLTGATGATDTITFSTPVTNPVMAIWSLGQGGDTASFVFTSTEPFTIVSGGPSAEYAGSSIFTDPASPYTVFGTEGNGTVQFNGTFSSLTWTNPQSEYWYGFTVGVPGAVPEPATWAMMLLGFGMVGFALRKRPAHANVRTTVRYA